MAGGDARKGPVSAAGEGPVGRRRHGLRIVVDAVDGLGPVGEPGDVFGRDVDERRPVLQMLDQFGVRPEQPVHVGGEGPAAGPGVVSNELGIGDPAAVSELEVDIAERVSLGVEVAAEHPKRVDEQRPGRVSVVGPCPVQQVGDEPVGGFSADGFSEAGHGQGVALDGGVPPGVPAVVGLDLLHVSGGRSRGPAVPAVRR